MQINVPWLLKRGYVLTKFLKMFPGVTSIRNTISYMYDSEVKHDIVTKQPVSQPARQPASIRQLRPEGSRPHLGHGGENANK